MAFVHVRINENSQGRKVTYTINGAIYDAKFGVGYKEIRDGRNVLKFEGDGVCWTIVETLERNQLLEIVADSLGSFGLVSCAPEYRIIELNEERIQDIREDIKEDEEIEDKKFKKGLKWFGIILGIFVIGALIYGAYMEGLFN